jgi:hypothetical protein
MSGWRPAPRCLLLLSSAFAGPPLRFAVCYFMVACVELHHMEADDGPLRCIRDQDSWLWCEFRDGCYSGYRMTRLRGKAKPARPYTCSLIIFTSDVALDWA